MANQNEGNLLNMFTYNLHPCYWNTLLSDLIDAYGENSEHFLQLVPIVKIQNVLFHQVPITAGCTDVKFCLTLIHMSSSRNRTPGLLILSPMPYPLCQMLPNMTQNCISVFMSCLASKCIRCHILSISHIVSSETKGSNWLLF